MTQPLKGPNAVSVGTRRGLGRKVLAAPQPRVPVIGLEAEFSLYVQEEKRLPEHVFRDPRQIVRERMIPRTGRSYHLPSGGALYFDTGVIEVATPIIELEPGCCVRGVRSLWEQIEYLRGELNAWESRTSSSARLEGFSTHYNISILNGTDLEALARLLTYILPAPAMLLAANRLSTGIGVRPREHRVEVTADFTPDPALMTATATFLIAVVATIAAWPSHGLDELKRRGIPVIEGFAPGPHTSRKGFLAKYTCFPENPFTTDPNIPVWRLVDGRTVSLRKMAMEIARPFRRAMRELADAETVRHVFAVLGGKARSLLDFADRPPRYEDAGRQVDWNRRHIHDKLPRSKYEKVIQRIITHRPIRVGDASYLPERMRGWYEVVFRNAKTGRRRVFNLDDLVRHCAV
jgi:hypothetical protein